MSPKPFPNQIHLCEEDLQVASCLGIDDVISITGARIEKTGRKTAPKCQNSVSCLQHLKHLERTSRELTCKVLFGRQRLKILLAPTQMNLVGKGLRRHALLDPSGSLHINNLLQNTYLRLCVVFALQTLHAKHEVVDVYQQILGVQCFASVKVLLSATICRLHRHVTKVTTTTGSDNTIYHYIGRYFCMLTLYVP